MTFYAISLMDTTEKGCNFLWLYNNIYIKLRINFYTEMMDFIASNEHIIHVVFGERKDHKSSKWTSWLWILSPPDKISRVNIAALRIKGQVHRRAFRTCVDKYSGSMFRFDIHSSPRGWLPSDQVGWDAKVHDLVKKIATDDVYKETQLHYLHLHNYIFRLALYIHLSVL